MAAGNQQKYLEYSFSVNAISFPSRASIGAHKLKMIKLLKIKRRGFFFHEMAFVFCVMHCENSEVQIAVRNTKKLPKSLICALHCANSLWIQVSVSPRSLPLGTFGGRNIYDLAPKVLYWWCRFVQNLVNKRWLVAGSSYFLLAIYIRITTVQKTTGHKDKM